MQGSSSSDSNMSDKERKIVKLCSSSIHHPILAFIYTHKIPYAFFKPVVPDRFMESSKRRVEYRKTFEPEEQEDDDGEGEQNSQEKPTAVKVSDGEALGAREGATTAVGRVESRNGRRASAAPARAQERGEEHSPAGKAGGGGTTVVGNAAKERLDREAERGAMEEQLENETLAIFNELRECMTFHDLL